MSIAFKKWVMDGYQMVHEKTYDTFDKLHDKVAVSPEELARHEKEIWSIITDRKKENTKRSITKNLLRNLNLNNGKKLNVLLGRVQHQKIWKKLFMKS